MPTDHILGSTSPVAGFIDVTVDIDPVWWSMPKYGGGTMGDLWMDLTGGLSLITTLTALFSTLADEGITEDTRAQYASTDVPGRAEQYQTYMGTSNKCFGFNFQWHAQVPDAANAHDVTMYSPRWCVQQARWLDLLKQPIYDAVWDLSYAPPPVVFRVGSLLVARCILTGGSPRWGGPFDPTTMLPYHVEFPAQFTVVRAAPIFDAGSDAYAAYISDGTPEENQFLRFAGATGI